MSVSQMKQFVANDLRVMKSQSKAVALHISASEAIQREKGSNFETQLPVEHALVSGVNTKENISYIEDCMALLKPMTIALRLICLLSHCGDGLLLSDYQRLKTQFIQAYGFNHLVTWNNLVKLGIIRIKGGITQSSSLSNIKAEAASLAASKIGIGSRGGNFQQIVKKLNLIPENTSLSEPSNASYVFNGAYTPLTCRLVEEVVRTNCKTTNTVLADTLKMMPGDSVIQWSGDTGNKVSSMIIL